MGKQKTNKNMDIIKCILLQLTDNNCEPFVITFH